MEVFFKKLKFSFHLGKADVLCQVRPLRKLLSNSTDFYRLKVFITTLTLSSIWNNDTNKKKIQRRNSGAYSCNFSFLSSFVFIPYTFILLSYIDRLTSEVNFHRQSVVHFAVLDDTLIMFANKHSSSWIGTDCRTLSQSGFCRGAVKTCSFCVLLLTAVAFPGARGKRRKRSQ